MYRCYQQLDCTDTNLLINLFPSILAPSTYISGPQQPSISHNPCFPLDQTSPLLAISTIIVISRTPSLRKAYSAPASLYPKTIKNRLSLQKPPKTSQATRFLREATSLFQPVPFLQSLPSCATVQSSLPTSQCIKHVRGIILAKAQRHTHTHTANSINDCIRLTLVLFVTLKRSRFHSRSIPNCYGSLLSAIAISLNSPLQATVRPTQSDEIGQPLLQLPPDVFDHLHAIHAVRMWRMKH